MTRNSGILRVGEAELCERSARPRDRDGVAIDLGEEAGQDDRGDLLERTLRSMLVQLDQRPARIIVHEDVRPDQPFVAGRTQALLASIERDFGRPALLLQTNPDGRKKAETGLSWRKNTNNNFCANSNTRGIDLNRNMVFQWGGQGASATPCNETYRGPSALSEPESFAIDAYQRLLFPDRRGPNLGDAAPADADGIYIDVHNNAAEVLWPYGFDDVSVAPNNTALQTLGRRLAWFNGYEPMQSNQLYAAAGATGGRVTDVTLTRRDTALVTMRLDEEAAPIGAATVSLGDRMRATGSDTDYCVSEPYALNPRGGNNSHAGTC